MAEMRMRSDPAAQDSGEGMLAEELAPPPGFEVLTGAACEAAPLRSPLWQTRLCRDDRLVILRAAQRETLLKAGIEDPASLGSGPLVAGRIGGGRVPHVLVRVGTESWVLKAYHRGGMVARWNSSRYWGASRFLRELAVAVHAERSGVPTAEVLALVLRGAGLGSVRAWLVTRYLPGARPLSEFFGTSDEARIFRAAGEAVRHMHRAGIDHTDLNVTNIIASAEGAEPRVFVIDWDRARIRRRGAWNAHANLARLWRSVDKGLRLGRFRMPARGGVSWMRPLRAFLRGYFGEARELTPEVRAYFRRRRARLAWRSLFWRRS